VKPLAADLDALCRRMRGESHVALAVHEKPDADALGAAAGMLDLFAQLGVDAGLYVSEDELLPLGDVLLPMERVRRGAPRAGAALYALDSGNPSRLALPAWGDVTVNIDHHHDNPRYGDLTFVRGEASSTSELVCDIARALGLRPSPQAAAALYAGISFDTGHFHHDSTAPSTFRTAAWLVELGVDVTGMYALLYERRSEASLRLWARAIGAARSVAAGRALLACVTAEDYAATGAGPDETEGVVDSLRGVHGVEVAALVKEQNGGARTRVSLRSETIDVSAVAALQDGGGHKLAAGFSSDDSPEEVIAWLSSELERRLSTASS
jgi:bifunctional oligoribonuclease and PAP phosphatase NrnA